MLNSKQKNKFGLVVFLLVMMSVHTGSADASAITSGKMLELTNESRNEAGLGSLTINEKLVVAAKAKADDMFSKQYFEHNSPEGLTPWYWFNYAGYEYVYAAENLAIDFVTAEGAHNALMKSTGHRDNILGRNYQEVGIAVVEGEFEGRDTMIIVEEFGSRREPKITINNATFFENKSEVKSAAIESAEVTTPVTYETEKAESVVKENLRPTNEDEISVTVLENDPGIEEISYKTDGNYDQVDIQASIAPIEEDAGKAFTKVYSIKNVSQLKKVYTEDIYWERVERDDIVDSLGGNTIRFRLLIKDFMNGLLYISANIE